MLDSEEDDYECPLCMEELDIADRNFKPCTCGYQICRFCWHHIKENLNGRCPACRREYSDQMAEFEPISADEISRIKREKKEKERQQKDMEAANRRHLANMRVVQKNLVYIIGLHPKLASEDVIRSNDFFGQFGKIAKVVINKRPVATTSTPTGGTTMQPSAAIYVTYQRKEDAAKAINGVDGTVMAGRILRASYGTTKYCTYYLRNMTCPNPTCLYLHEPGEEADTISKEELATGKHRMRDQMSSDAEDRNHISNTHSSGSISSNNDIGPSSSSSTTGRKQATLESVATISYKSSRPEITSTSSYSKPSTASIVNTNDHMLDDDRPALPATASWAKAGSGPSTPVIKSSILPERSLTPDNFGPPLAVAVAAAAQKQQQQAANASKRKQEKKKRKEQQQQLLQQQQQQQQLQQQQKSESSSGSHPATPSTATEPDLVTVASNGDDFDLLRTEQNAMGAGTTAPYGYDGLIGFVLGDALGEVCSLMPNQDKLDEEDEPVGVSALHDKEPIRKNSNLLIDDDDEEEEDDKLGMSPLEFLTNSTPTHTYSGSFNPFTHQILRSTGTLFETPMRKCSRFGFAQI
ncbi:hypothetical protein INT45_009229 [Circinella minor]|uniref:CCR4-NOT transcription complex subunit 4 n=1 Tax=Circinella minor TaxID=1195481 RepID=A0A8H7SF69_9FUNG|nr:hypothetical protein INT45_009229 [Circinella minor]